MDRTPTPPLPGQDPAPAPLQAGPSCRAPPGATPTGWRGRGYFGLRARKVPREDGLGQRRVGRAPNPECPVQQAARLAGFRGEPLRPFLWIRARAGLQSASELPRWPGAARGGPTLPRTRLRARIQGKHSARGCPVPHVETLCGCLWLLEAAVPGTPSQFCQVDGVTQCPAGTQAGT